MTLFFVKTIGRWTPFPRGGTHQGKNLASFLDIVPPFEQHRKLPDTLSGFIKATLSRARVWDNHYWQARGNAPQAKAAEEGAHVIVDSRADMHSRPVQVQPTRGKIVSRPITAYVCC